MTAFVAAAVQFAVPADPHAALAQSTAAVAAAAAGGARLVVLPELHTSPYFCRREDPALFDRAEPVPGPCTEALADAARRAGVVVVGSLFERRAPGLYHNTAVVFDADGRIAGVYRKMHIPEDPGYHEKFYFTPGDTGFGAFDTAVGRVGVLVCWDQWYPEAARLTAMAGADLLVYPTAVGWDMRDDEAERGRQRDAWVTIQRGHAVADGLYVLAANRIGDEADPGDTTPGTRFWGTSFVCGPQGELLATAPPDAPAVVYATIDPARSEAVRRMWPFFRDRRIDAYGGLTKRWG